MKLMVITKARRTKISNFYEISYSEEEIPVKLMVITEARRIKISKFYEHSYLEP